VLRKTYRTIKIHAKEKQTSEKEDKPKGNAAFLSLLSNVPFPSNVVGRPCSQA
jgi:hypothetical protein